MDTQLRSITREAEAGGIVSSGLEWDAKEGSLSLSLFLKKRPKAIVSNSGDFHVFWFAGDQQCSTGSALAITPNLTERHILRLCCDSPGEAVTSGHDILLIVIVTRAFLGLLRTDLHK